MQTVHVPAATVRGGIYMQASYPERGVGITCLFLHRIILLRGWERQARYSILLRIPLGQHCDCTRGLVSTRAL